MNKILKTIIVIIISLIVLVSMAANIYTFGIKSFETYYESKGAQTVLSQIVQAVNQNGEIQITKDITLIKKDNGTKAPAK